jgi:hypothetical protein
MKQKMIEAENSDKYIFSDGKVLSMTCNYADNTIVLKLQIRKKVENQVVSCAVRLRFENVSKLDLTPIEDMGVVYVETKKYKKGQNKLQFLTRLKTSKGDRVLPTSIRFFVK